MTLRMNSGLKCKMKPITEKLSYSAVLETGVGKGFQEIVAAEFHHISASYMSCAAAKFTQRAVLQDIVWILSKYCMLTLGLEVGYRKYDTGYMLCCDSLSYTNTSYCNGGCPLLCHCFA